MTGQDPKRHTGSSSISDRLWDAVVVGAGPAGAMTAHELARLGCSVLLLERQAFPRWKVCGACLSPGAQEVLRGVGLGDLPDRLGGVPLKTMQLRGWSLHSDFPLQGSVALSRGALDTALVEAAQTRGAHFLPQARARLNQIADDGASLQVEIPGRSFRLTARVLVAADGLRSGLMAQAGVVRPEGDVRRGGKIGLGAVFETQLSAYGPGVIHMAVGHQGYVGLVRAEDGMLNVGAAVNRSSLGKGEPPESLVQKILQGAGFPELEGEPLEGWKGTPGLGYGPPRLGGERLFAVGDAAGFVEPFTGEGMSWALAGGVALAPIVRDASMRWDETLLRVWEGRHRRTIGRAQRLSRWAAWTVGRPILSRAILNILSLSPQVAAPFVRRAATPPKLRFRGAS
jgi:flavin-dependent dehydrogenase